MKFTTPRISSVLGFWFLALLTLCVIVAWATSADAQEERVERVNDTSPCNGIVERWEGSQLIEASVNPDTLAAKMVFFKRLEGDKAMIYILVRESCTAPWRPVKAIPLTLKPATKPCVNTETSQCL